MAFALLKFSAFFSELFALGGEWIERLITADAEVAETTIVRHS